MKLMPLALGAGLVAVGLVAANAQETTPLSDYDTDADSMVSAEEFGTRLGTEAEGGTFARYDADQSGEISEDEFGAGEFARLDWNKDGSIDEEEFGIAMGEQGVLLSDYDSDGDFQLTEEEFQSAASASAGPAWGDYDADASGGVSQDEFAQGEFRRYDANRDEMLDEQEFTTYHQSVNGSDDS